MIDYHFDWSVIWRNWDRFAAALGLGLGLAIASLAIGTVIGLFCAMGRVYGPRWVSWPVWAYVEVIRNTPLLLLVFFSVPSSPYLSLLSSPPSSLLCSCVTARSLHGQQD